MLVAKNMSTHRVKICEQEELPFFPVVFQGVFRKPDLALQDIVALRREHEQKVHNAINLEPWTGQT